MYKTPFRKSGLKLLLLNFVALTDNEETFKKLYYQAKHNHGTEELQLYKLVIFGPPGVGKSSLFKVLLGGIPDAVRKSTGPLVRNLVQIKVAITRLTGEYNSSWCLIRIEDEIARLRSAIKRKNFKQSKQIEANVPVDVADGDKPPMKVEKELFTNISTKAPTEVEYASSIMACYDTGGQPEFFDIMPALTTIPTGNIMVFDLSKDIHKKIDSEFYEDGESCQLQHQAPYTTAELMKTAVANIQSYCHQNSNTISYESNTGHLLVVGTHLDLCGQTDYKKSKKLHEVETMILNDVLTGEAEQMVHYDCEGRIIHPISNTCSDGRNEAAQKIRTAIEDMKKYTVMCPLIGCYFN